MSHIHLQPPNVLLLKDYKFDTSKTVMEVLYVWLMETEMVTHVDNGSGCYYSNQNLTGVGVCHEVSCSFGKRARLCRLNAWC